jgi:trans-aconitate 2-methyltransferase
VTIRTIRPVGRRRFSTGPRSRHQPHGEAYPSALQSSGASGTGGHDDALTWDVEAYDRLSDPQYTWGQRVLDRLDLRGDETVIDAGCGSGRLTALLLERLPRGRVIAVDNSEPMLTKAQANLAAHGERVTYLCADLQTLELAQPVDAVFSTATFHWILDHDRLFRALATVLVPGGRLEAQCGGGPNLARLRARVARLIDERYARYFADWHEPWLFADPSESAAQLENAGFVDVETRLEPAPTHFDTARDFRLFLERVVLWPHLTRLPDSLQQPFLDALVAEAANDHDPFVLDYWRLNLSGQRSAPERTPTALPHHR